MSDKEERKEGEEELDNIIVLTDDEGNDVEFEWLDTVRMNDTDYVVVLPTDEGAEEVVILKIEPEEDEDTFVGLEDEDEINKVFERFKEKNEGIFDFED